jgi:hypothetical protein
MVSNALLPAIDIKLIGVTKIDLSNMLPLRSRINAATLGQEMKAFRVDFRVLMNLSTIRILLSFFGTQSFLKQLSNVVSTKTIFWAQSLG